MAAKVIPLTGLTVRGESLVDGPDGLELGFGLDLSAQDGSGKAARWTARRKLEVTVYVRDNIADGPGDSRKVIVTVHIVVPSPYWPTVVAWIPGQLGPRQLAASPAPSVGFLQGPGGTMEPAESPELQLAEAIKARLVAYDGRWDGATRSWAEPGAFQFSGAASPVAQAGLDYLSEARLVDQSVVQLGEDDPVDVTVIRVESYAALPTNILLRPNPAVPLHEPRPGARAPPLGRYQTTVAQNLSEVGRTEAGERIRTGAGFDHDDEPMQAGEAAGATTSAGSAATKSLYQLLIPTGSSELPGVITFGRLPTAGPGADVRWVGLGDGPSEALAATPEWARFARLASQVGSRALEGGIPDWLPSMDLTAAGAGLVRDFIEAHRALVSVAATEIDRFWARYPFSVFLVDGGRGPERGTLQAIFLSPMHPARVGWLFAAQIHAMSLGGSPRLMGLADGWNIPALGQAPGAAGGTDSLVAAPLDPGVDGDNIGWSSLVKTSGNGIARPQLMAAGHRLPWGGRSGLTEQVVVQALNDYVSAHPHVSSLQVELRAAVEAPRSAEVDRAVVEWASENAGKVGGIIRVLDSSKRLGRPPARDDLPEKADGTSRGRFTWLIARPGDEPPGHVDIAFVENTAPFTRIVDGPAVAPSPALPLKRFTSAEDNQAHQVDYRHGARVPDLLGMGALLSLLEPPGATMWVETTLDSLQSLDTVRWEVIGDINLEPDQMARLAGSTPAARQLWEWRPGWLSADGGNAVRGGGHYVLAQAPRSLLAGRPGMRPPTLHQASGARDQCD